MPHLHESGPSFLDFQVRKTGFIASRKSKELLPRDIVSDERGFPGIVKFTSEIKGVWVEFADGREGYDKDLKVKLRIMSTSNEAFFDHQRKYMGFILSLGRIMGESIKDSFPHVAVSYTGNEVYVRGSSLGGITKKFTAQKINDNHSFFGAKLTPFYNCEIQSFDIKRSQRRSRFSRDLLRNLFVDIDLKQRQANRIRFIINDPNEYNKEVWARTDKMFKKFNINFARM